MGMNSPLKDAYRNLMASTASSAQDLHRVLSTHPAAQYTKVSLLYNRYYAALEPKCANIYATRAYTSAKVLSLLDQVARAMELVSANYHTDIPHSVRNELATLRENQKKLGTAPKQLKEFRFNTRSRKKLAPVVPVVAPSAKTLGAGTSIQRRVVTKAVDSLEKLIPTVQKPEEKARNQELNAFTSLISSTARKGN